MIASGPRTAVEHSSGTIASSTPILRPRGAAASGTARSRVRSRRCREVILVQNFFLAPPGVAQSPFIVERVERFSITSFRSATPYEFGLEVAALIRPMLVDILARLAQSMIANGASPPFAPVGVIVARSVVRQIPPGGDA